MNVETNEDRNTLLDACGCCLFPVSLIIDYDIECRGAQFDCFHTNISFPSGWGFEPHPWDDGSLDDEKAYTVATHTITKTDSIGRFYQEETITTYTYDPITFACSSSTVVNQSGANFNYTFRTLTLENKTTAGVPGDASVETRIYREYLVSSGTRTYTIDDKWTYTGYLSKATRIANATAEMQAAAWGACASGVESEVSFGVSSATKSPRCVVSQKRIRWGVSTAWPGSYYKVTWDIVDEPDFWDEDPPSPPGTVRSWFAQDLTWVWSGPGDPAVPSDWLSPWFEIALPPYAGVRRPVNFRYAGFRSTKFGSAPDITGPLLADDEL